MTMAEASVPGTDSLTMSGKAAGQYNSFRQGDVAFTLRRWVYSSLVAGTGADGSRVSAVEVGLSCRTAFIVEGRDMLVR